MARVAGCTEVLYSTQIGHTGNWPMKHHPALRFAINSEAGVNISDVALATSREPSLKHAVELNLHSLRNRKALTACPLPVKYSRFLKYALCTGGAYVSSRTSHTEAGKPSQALRQLRVMAVWPLELHYCLRWDQCL